MKEHITNCNECKIEPSKCFVKRLACTARNRQVCNMLYCPEGFWGIKPIELERKCIKTISSTTDNLNILKITLDQILKTHGLTQEQVNIETIKKENTYDIKIYKRKGIENGE